MLYSTSLIGLLTIVLIALSRSGLYFLSLFLLGLVLGMVLYLSRFGFASTYRKLIIHGDTEGVRAQLVMLMLATLLFPPILATGQIFGKETIGAIGSVGWQVAIGAFMFGIGMQLGGGCGSGTLYALGGGNLRMFITLAAFIFGSFWASLHMGWWQALPSIGPWSLADKIGWRAAIALQLAVLATLLLLLPRYRATENGPSTRSSMLSIPWSLMQGAIALALLNAATLVISGHPWTITWAFTLWGAKIATLTGWSPIAYSFWHGEFQQHALSNSILNDETSLMNFGIIFGAMLAALHSRRLTLIWRISPRGIIASLIGGLAMGYGARIAFGCNIGAFFSGIASTSLHGWLWIAAAFAGTWIGIWLRPKFGLLN